MDKKPRITLLKIMGFLILLSLVATAWYQYYGQ